MTELDTSVVVAAFAPWHEAPALVGLTAQSFGHERTYRSLGIAYLLLAQ